MRRKTIASANCERPKKMTFRVKKADNEAASRVKTLLDFIQTEKVQSQNEKNKTLPLVGFTNKRKAQKNFILQRDEYLTSTFH